MLIFDIETNGLYADVRNIYCMSYYDTDTDKLSKFDVSRVQEGCRQLYNYWASGGCIGGHNIINYDIPVLSKLYKWFVVTEDMKTRVFDTLVIARLIYSSLDAWDGRLKAAGKLPSKLFMSHKLAAWGYRLGVLKGTYGESEDAWSGYNPEMLEYNAQDVMVTKALYDRLMEKNYSQTAIDLEHAVAWVMSKQEKNGFPFDVEKAKKLETVLRSRFGIIQAELVKLIPPIPDKIFVPKRDNKRLGYKKGVPIQRYKDFNPNSRQQIEWVIRDYFKYSPDNPDCYATEEETDDYKQFRLKIDDESLKYMQEDAAASDELKHILSILQESLMLKKRLGQLADGNNAWLKLVDKDGLIHGGVITNGAVTGRATHHNPNVAQVPHIGTEYGKECRELFNSGDWWQAGIDACGLELRCLAHFMYKYDNGKYAHTILTGDIHTMNQEAAGLPTRNQAKTFN